MAIACSPPQNSLMYEIQVSLRGAQSQPQGAQSKLQDVDDIQNNTLRKPMGIQARVMLSQR